MFLHLPVDQLMRITIISYIIFWLAVTLVLVRRGWFKALVIVSLFFVTAVGIWAVRKYLHYPAIVPLIHNDNGHILVSDKNEYIKYNIRLIHYAFWAFVAFIYSFIKR